ncbi:hypothetical protein [Catenulispora yoronensis]|uniref:hypothetical protein n=1 Tax=Catenulispora yoronensis TaxID=450799 RepID=UPI0031E3AAF5
MSTKDKVMLGIGLGVGAALLATAVVGAAAEGATVEVVVIGATTVVRLQDKYGLAA